MPKYYVNACWDEEAGVWFSETDIPGLVIEAATLPEFEALMNELAPEMLSLNAHVLAGPVPVNYSVHRTVELAVA